MDLGGVREDVVLGDVHRLCRVLRALLVDHCRSHRLISSHRKSLEHQGTIIQGICAYPNELESCW